MPHEVEEGRDNKTNIDFRIEVPGGGVVFLQVRSKNDLSKEVTQATRTFITSDHPSIVVGPVQALTEKKR